MCLFLAYTCPPRAPAGFTDPDCFSLEETTLTLYNRMIYGSVGVVLSHAYIMILQQAGMSQGNSHHVIDRG